MRASYLSLLLLPALMLPPAAASAAEPASKPAKSSAARWDLDPHDLSTLGAKPLLVKIGFIARFDEAERAAKAGDATAATLLALAYQSGTGIQPDQQRALTYAERAAKAGSARAMTTLGTLLAARDDHGMAFDWFRRSADAGNAVGMTNLGNAYAQGRGVAKDPDQALTLYRRAADQGATMGMLRLANAYLEGAGIPRDDAAAAAWVRKAAELGDSDGDRMMGELHLAGRGVPADMAQARAWMQRAADKGNVHARTRLAAIEAQQQQAVAAAEAQRQAQLAAAEEDDDDDDALGMLAGVALGAMAGGGSQTAQVMSNVLANTSPNVAAGAQMGAALGAAGVGRTGGLPLGDLGVAPGGFAVPNYGAGKTPATQAAAGAVAQKPNTLLGSAACRGYTNENFQSYYQQHSNGPDAQLHALCAGAFNYYSMYLNAIRKGFSAADCDRTYKAFTDSALVATEFYRTAR